MAHDPTFAEVLSGEPMFTDSMLVSYANTMMAVERLLEQNDPGFSSTGQQRPSGSISQYSEDSRTGNAPRSGAQARLDIIPRDVVMWTSEDFLAEVKWYEFAQDRDFGKLKVERSAFRARTPDLRAPDEAAASRLWDTNFMYPATDQAIGRNAFSAPNGWTDFNIVCSPESSAPGHRVDWTWTRAAFGASENFGEPSGEGTARFLVHEHKSPGKFPYGLVQEDHDTIVEALRESEGWNINEAKAAVQGAWEASCEALSEYWHLVDPIDNVERQTRFRYPLIQIYVYMLRSFCKYGVLSTTDRTWFLKLDRDNVLHVTAAFLPTRIEEKSMRYAYTCVLYKALTSPARLEMTDDALWEIARTDIRHGSAEWRRLYGILREVLVAQGAGSGVGATSGTGSSSSSSSASGAYEHSSGGPKEGAKDTTADADREAELRELLPLKSDLTFPYAGGLVGVVDRYPEGQFGYALRVDTSGIDTVVKIMTPAKHEEDARVAEAAFAREMRVYKALRPIWGTHVPWFLYGGRHIFNDLIVATTYAGESLGGVPATEEIKDKAWGALMAVHDLGVAHRDLLLRNFVMDSSGTVRLIDFAQAKLEASPRDLQKDREDFSRAFSPRRSQARRGRLS